jgi:hypothetical protein
VSPEPAPRYVTLKAAVKRYGRSRSSLYLHLKHKDFEAIKVNGHTLIRVESADKFFDDQPKWEAGK